MTAYQWVTIGLGAIGFIGTWILGAFKLGQAVEQMKANAHKEVEEESDKIISKIGLIENRFSDDLRAQDHNFGEVGAAMRQYISDVEKKLREVEIWGRDNYVQKSEFEKATDQIRSDIRALGADIKHDIRELNTKVITK